MPLQTSNCQRCHTPLQWRVVDDMPRPFELDGKAHRDYCPKFLDYAKAKSFDKPELITPVYGGYVIGIDLETTGIPGRIENPEIIELAAAVLRMSDGKVMETFTQLVKPRGPLLAQDVHHISEEMVEDAPYIEGAMIHFEHWRRMVQRRFQDTPMPLVSHNAAFELSFLDPCDVEGPWICTLIMSQEMAPGRMARGYHALSSIVERMGLTYQGAAHRALPDAIICAEVYWMMVQEQLIWNDLVDMGMFRLGEVRNNIASCAPITAGLLLKVEVELMRRLRMFQERPTGRKAIKTEPEGVLVPPWSPPETVPPYSYRFCEELVFRPLVESLREIRLVYRAERLGISLDDLANLRKKPEFDHNSLPTKPERVVQEEQPGMHAPVQPHFPDELKRTRYVSAQERMLEAVVPNAPSQPSFDKGNLPNDRWRNPNDVDNGPSDIRSPHQPDFSSPSAATLPLPRRTQKPFEEPKHRAPFQPKFNK